jgi:hypothetical protein
MMAGIAATVAASCVGIFVSVFVKSDFAGAVLGGALYGALFKRWTEPTLKARLGAWAWMLVAVFARFYQEKGFVFVNVEPAIAAAVVATVILAIGYAPAGKSVDRLL